MRILLTVLGIAPRGLRVANLSQSNERSACQGCVNLSAHGSADNRQHPKPWFLPLLPLGKFEQWTIGQQLVLTIKGFDWLLLIWLGFLSPLAAIAMAGYGLMMASISELFIIIVAPMIIIFHWWIGKQFIRARLPGMITVLK